METPCICVGMWVCIHVYHIYACTYTFGFVNIQGALQAREYVMERRHMLLTVINPTQEYALTENCGLGDYFH